VAEDTSFAGASRRHLPLSPTARLATRAFGIPVVCTPDAPNSLHALRGGHCDPRRICASTRGSRPWCPRVKACLSFGQKADFSNE